MIVCVELSARVLFAHLSGPYLMFLFRIRTLLAAGARRLLDRNLVLQNTTTAKFYAPTSKGQYTVFLSSPKFFRFKRKFAELV